MGPRRAESALATVNLEIVPRRDRRGSDEARGANQDAHDGGSDGASTPSLNMGRSHFSHDSSASSDDGPGPRQGEALPGNTGSSSSGRPPSQANSSSRNIGPSLNQQPRSPNDGSAGNVGSPSRRSNSGRGSNNSSQVQQGSGPNQSQGDLQGGQDSQQAQSGGSAIGEEDVPSQMGQEQGIISPSSSHLSDGPTSFSLDPRCDDLSSEIDLRRINISPDGIGMNSDGDDSYEGDDDDNHNDDEDGDNQNDGGPSAIMAANTANTQSARQRSTASAIARGDAARQALRAARRSPSGPSRLARVLARLHIRPLPRPSPPALRPRIEQAQRAARSSRFNLPRILRRPGATPAAPARPSDRQARRRRRPSPAQQQKQRPAARSPRPIPLQTVNVLPLQAPAAGPAAAGQPPNRLRRVGRLPERPNPSLNSPPRNPSSRPGPLPARRARGLPPIAGQARIRTRRPGRLPEWRSPPLGSLQGIPYPNAIPGQGQSIPVVPTDDNATAHPPYISLDGAHLVLNDAEVAPGGNMIANNVPPIGDPRHLARAYAGEAVMDTSLPQGQPDTIWHTPSLDMRPIPGYFRSHWMTLLGVQRVVYFYRVGSEGANAVLATRLQNPVQSSTAARQR